MATRKISEIVADMKAALENESLDASALRAQMNHRANEFDATLAKWKSDDKFINVVLLLIALFTGAFAIITNLSNDDLREDVTQKKEIINKYEKAVGYDTISTYEGKDGKEVTVSSLLKDNMKLITKVALLESELEFSELKLKAIKQMYGIEFVKEDSTYRIEAKQADSARMLLPVFRNRLKYDSIKKQWFVEHKYVKVGDKTYPED